MPRAGHVSCPTALWRSPLGYSLDLYDVVVTQDAHPDPAILRIERLSASVRWRALLAGRLVGDVELEKPAVYLDLPQARQEIADPTPVKERGWQDALEAIYPLKIDHVEIRGGDITYIDDGPFKPLRLRSLDLVATQANFLAEPNPTFRGDVELGDIELDYFKPITNRGKTYQVKIRTRRARRRRADWFSARRRAHRSWHLPCPTTRRGVATKRRSEKEGAMFRFVVGMLVGGLAVWYWGEEIREYAGSRTVDVRRSAANVIRTVGKKAEDVLDRTKDQVNAASQAGQDAIRPPQRH